MTEQTNEIFKSVAKLYEKSRLTARRYFYDWLADEYETGRVFTPQSARDINSFDYFTRATITIGETSALTSRQIRGIIAGAEACRQAPLFDGRPGRVEWASRKGCEEFAEELKKRLPKVEKKERQAAARRAELAQIELWGK